MRVLWSFYLHVKNLRSPDLRLTLGGPLLCRLLCVSQYRCQDAVGQKKAISHSLASTGRYTFMGTERRAKVMSASTIINNRSHGQNLSLTSGEAEPFAHLREAMGLHTVEHEAWLCTITVELQLYFQSARRWAAPVRAADTVRKKAGGTARPSRTKSKSYLRRVTLLQSARPSRRVGPAL
jgi:hypothetical protein